MREEGRDGSERGREGKNEGEEGGRREGERELVP